MAYTTSQGLTVINTGAADTALAQGFPTGDSVNRAIERNVGAAQTALATIDGLRVTATQVSAAAGASATITGTAPYKTLNIGIPAGRDGLGSADQVATFAAAASRRAASWIRAALAAGTLRLVTLGDSNSEGTGSSQIIYRYPERIVAGMRLKVTGAGGDTHPTGWYPAANLSAVSQGWSRSRDAMSAADNNGIFGGLACCLDQPGDVLTSPTTEFSRFTIMWEKMGFRQGSFEVVLDGTVVDTVSAAQSSTHGDKPAARVGFGVRSKTYICALGQHTVRLRFKDVGAQYPGVKILGGHFATSSTGVSLWNAAAAGTRADQWAKGDPQWGKPAFADIWYQALALVDPHLVTVALGINDRHNPDPGVWRPAAYADHIKTICDRIQAAAPNAAILIITPSPCQEHIDAAGVDVVIRDYEREVRDRVGGRDRVSVVAQSWWWTPSPGPVADPLGMLWATGSPGEVHWSDAGYGMIADSLLGWIFQDRQGVPGAKGDAGSPTQYELRGSGTPEGAVSAPVGTYYTATAPVMGATRWVKVAGTGSTGWQVVQGDTGWLTVVEWDANGTFSRGSLPAGWKPRNAGHVRVRRVGALCWVRILNIACAVTNTADRIWTAPTGFAPDANALPTGSPIGTFTSSSQLKDFLIRPDLARLGAGNNAILVDDFIYLGLLSYPTDPSHPWPTAAP